MSKKVDNSFIPKLVLKNLKWHERDALMTWYGQMKCQDFLEDLDGHFENLEIVNFDIINSKGKLSESKMKQYQTASHSEILTYPQHNQDEILSSAFRIKRNSMQVKIKV